MTMTSIYLTYFHLCLIKIAYICVLIRNGDASEWETAQHHSKLAGIISVGDLGTNTCKGSLMQKKKKKKITPPSDLKKFQGSPF